MLSLFCFSNHLWMSVIFTVNHPKQNMKLLTYKNEDAELLNKVMTVGLVHMDNDDDDDDDDDD